MPSGYLVEIPEREREAVRRLLKLPFISTEFFGSLGLNPSFSWYLLEVKKERLVDSLPGDVDILAGRLDWSDPKAFESILLQEAKSNPDAHPSWHYNSAALKLSDSGGLRWPPLSDYLVGIEAKCAYLDPRSKQISVDAVKSTKKSASRVRHIRSQVNSLLQMGFDQVALLDMIANPPAAGPDGSAWMQASCIAASSWEAMLPIFKERLPKDSPAGHWVWPIGSVIGGDETVRGTGAPVELRRARKAQLLQQNPKAQSRRRDMEGKLGSILVGFPPPRSFPVILIDCRSCSTTHLREDVCKAP